MCYNETVMKNNKIKIFGILLIILVFIPISGLSAQEESVLAQNNREFAINLDKATIAKGYTVAAFGDKFKLSLVPGILNAATAVEIIELHEDLPLPWQMDLISNFYQFEFKNKAAYDNHKPFYIQFAYEELNNNHKQVFFYDKNSGAWRPLPTKDFPKEKFVRSLIHLPFARIAVFAFPDVLTVGEASWYSYKPGNFAASPDFPKDSRLRVRNLDNDKFVDVVVNDFGPDRAFFPERALDLEKNAFMQIAKLGEGIINISIEPLLIADANSASTLALGEGEAKDTPQIGLKAALVMDEAQNKILWEKNSTSTLPLASLTKLIAVKVFLDTKPTLDNVVAYSIKDEEYNYQHVNKWESARLRIADGETLTINDLIYTSLVGSANNTIETLVRVSPLNRDEFIARMNFLVKEWGASTTHFIEPTGLAPQNVSSVRDYAIITKEVLNHPIIAKASTMPSYEFTTINKKVYHKIKNTSTILNSSKYAVNGSKTGYLIESGYCLMTRVDAGANSNLIVVTFGADSRAQSFNETEKLILYGLKKI